MSSGYKKVTFVGGPSKKKPVARTKIDKSQNSRIRKLERAMKFQAEIKHIDNIANVGSLVPHTGFLTSWNLPAQGDGQGLRDGDQVLVTGIDFRAQLINSGSTTTMTRCIVFQDLKNIVSSASAVLDIVGTVQAPLSSFQRENRNLFKVLFDRMYLTDAVSRGQAYIKFTKKFKRPVVQTYAPGTQNPTQNTFRVLMISDIATGAGAPAVDQVLRMYYHD